MNKSPKSKKTPVAKKTKVPKISKPKKYKIKLSDTPTFQDLVNPRYSETYGFCYKVTLQHPMDTTNTVYNYYGSKSLKHGKDYRFYQTSSEYVGRMLDAGFIATYEILSYHGSKYALLEAECALILSAWRDPVVRAGNRNSGLTLAGGARHITRYMWLKNTLGVIDTWPF